MRIAVVIALTAMNLAFFAWGWAAARIRYRELITLTEMENATLREENRWLATRLMELREPMEKPECPLCGSEEEAQ